MPRATQVIDSLWHCLCPSFYAFPKHYTRIPRLTAPNAPRSVAIARPAATRSLLHHSSDRRPRKESPQHLRRLEIRKLYATHDPRFGNPEDERVLKHISETAIWEELRKASSKGDFVRVQRIVRILVTVHGELPSPRLYTALILANTSSQYGSVQEVEHILGEMAEEGLSPDSTAYHAVLKVHFVLGVPRSFVADRP